MISVFCEGVSSASQKAGLPNIGFSYALLATMSARKGSTVTKNVKDYMRLTATAISKALNESLPNGVAAFIATTHMTTTATGAGDEFWDIRTIVHVTSVTTDKDSGDVATVIDAQVFNERDKDEICQSDSDIESDNAGRGQGD